MAGERVEKKADCWVCWKADQRAASLVVYSALRSAAHWAARWVASTVEHLVALKAARKAAS